MQIEGSIKSSQRLVQSECPNGHISPKQLASAALRSERNDET